MRSPNALVGLAMLVVALGPASQPLWADNGPYSVQDVGPANGVAFGVNAGAVVVGSGGTTPRMSFLTPFGGGPLFLPGLQNSTEDIALGVHADGWAVGTSKVDFVLRPVSFESGSAIELMTSSASMGAAHAVNDSGAIAGWVVEAGVLAVVWTGGSRLEVPGTYYAQAFALNNAGVVTGTYVAGGAYRAFTWSAGTTPVLLASLGGITSKGNGINDQGDVVGDSFRTPTAFNEIAAFWPASGGVVDLGTFGGLTSSARDVNNHRQIVGYALNASGAPRAFLSDAGAALVDLSTLLPADSGWVLLSANAINDAGQIVGEGTFNGEPRAFLLTPPVASDTTPPVIAKVTTTPNSVWPPSHQMVDVSVGVDASDDSGETPACAVLSVASSEPDNATGDGDTWSDTQVVGATLVRVRAERAGPSGARVYTVTVQCTDGSGNAATGAGTVTIGEGTALKAKGKK